MRNRLYRRAHVSEVKFKKILRCFALDLTATRTAELAGLSLRAVNAIFGKLRRRIAERCEAEKPLRGTVEVDESYFGARRVRGKQGRGAYGKTIVFGIYRRNGQVQTEIVPDCSKPSLLRALRGRVHPASVVHSDGWTSYDGVVDLGYRKHFRIRKSEHGFANGRTHINGIEAFWSYAKRRLAKFNGIRRTTFYLHLKETEFRFNHRTQDLYRLLRLYLLETPL